MLTKIDGLRKGLKSDRVGLARGSSYDQFLFMDSLTNRSIAVRDMRKDRRKVRMQGKTRASSEEVQLRELDQCIGLLKSAGSFQKKNLREKLFGISEEPQQSSGDSHKPQELKYAAAQKRRIIRELISKTLTDRNKKELQKYLKDPMHRVDQQLLQLTRHETVPICKQNVSKVVEILSEKEEVEGMRRKEILEDFQKEPFVQKLSKLESDMGRQLKQRLRKAGLFLIENRQPGHLHKKIRREIDLGNMVDKGQPFREIKWQVASLQNSSIKKKPRMKIWQNPHKNNKIKQLSKVVQSGGLEELQIAVSRSPRQTLRQRDEKGNSLLHMCAQLNRGRLFEWLLGKRGVESLLEKNGEGETPVDIAERMSHRDVLKHVPRSLM